MYIPSRKHNRRKLNFLCRVVKLRRQWRLATSLGSTLGGQKKGTLHLITTVLTSDDSFESNITGGCGSRGSFFAHPGSIRKSCSFLRLIRLHHLFHQPRHVHLLLEQSTTQLRAISLFHSFSFPLFLSSAVRVRWSYDAPLLTNTRRLEHLCLWSLPSLLMCAARSTFSRRELGASRDYPCIMRARTAVSHTDFILDAPVAILQAFMNDDPYSLELLSGIVVTFERFIRRLNMEHVRLAKTSQLFFHFCNLLCKLFFLKIFFLYPKTDLGLNYFLAAKSSKYILIRRSLRFLQTVCIQISCVTHYFLAY